MEKGEIMPAIATNSVDISKDAYLHNVFFQTGIVFGFPSDLIFYKGDCSSWTEDEKLYFLLFESLLLVYITEKGSKDFQKQAFIELLLKFYEDYEKKSLLDMAKTVFGETPETKLESILRKRGHAKQNFKNTLWINYIYNSIIYVDVLAFRSFLLFNNEITESYEQYLNGVIYAIGVIALKNDISLGKKNRFLNSYLQSPFFKEEDKKEFFKRLEAESLDYKDIVLPSHAEDLYKLYLMDMAILSLHEDLSVISQGQSVEITHLEGLCTYLGLPSYRLKNSIILIERFVMMNNNHLNFHRQASSSERLYSNFSKRWVKVLGRNKDKLIQELSESKELIFLVKKSISTELTEEEQSKVKAQFMDIVKSLPAFAIFMLPGGMILLPLILKIIPELLPSAFKSNELEE